MGLDSVDSGKTKTGGGVRSNQVRRLGYLKCLNFSQTLAT